MRSGWCLDLEARLRFVGEGASSIYAVDVDTGRVLAFAADGSFDSVGTLPVAPRSEPALAGEIGGVPVFHTYASGHRVQRGATVLTPRRVFRPLAEDGDFVGEDDGGLFRLVDGARLGPPPGFDDAFVTAVHGGFVTTSSSAPLTLFPYGGAAAVRRADLVPFELAAAGGLLHVAEGQRLHVLDGATLETLHVASFPARVVAVRATRGVVLVETEEDTTYVVAGAQTRAIGPHVTSRWMVARHGRWLVHDDASAYVGEGTDTTAFVRFADRMAAEITVHPRAPVSVLRGGMLLTTESRWSFVPWRDLAEGEVAPPRRLLELAAPLVLPATVLFVGPSMLRVAVEGPSPATRATATLPSHGNPERLVAGQSVVAECIVRQELEPRLEVVRVVPAPSRARTTDASSPRDPVVVLRVGGGSVPAWIATLAELGFVEDASAVGRHLWHLRPHEALAAIHGARGGIERGFLAFDHKFQNDTKDAAKDLLRAAGARGVKITSRARDGSLRVTTTIGGTEATTTLDVEGSGLLPLVALVNEALARVSAEKRVHDVETGGDGYVFVACRPADVAVLEAAGFGRLHAGD